MNAAETLSTGRTLDSRDPTVGPPTRSWPEPRRAIAFTLAYAVALELGWTICGRDASLLAYWPAAGVLAGSLAVTTRKRWAPLLLLALLARAVWALAAREQAPIVALAFAAAEVAGAATCAYIGRRRIPASSGNELSRSLRWLFTRMVAAMLGGAVVTVSVSVLLARLLGAAPDFPPAQLFGAAALGMVSVAPAFLALRREQDAALAPFRERAGEAAAMILVVLVFASQRYVELPPVASILGTVGIFALFLWPAMRFGVVAVAGTSALLSAAAANGIVLGHGPLTLTPVPLEGRVLIAQVYLLTEALLGYVIANLHAELRASLWSLTSSNLRLSQNLERTHGALAERHAVLDAILASADEYIYAKDADGRYLFVNEAGQRFAGWTRPDLEGVTDEAFFSPEDAARIRADDALVLRTGEPLYLEETIEVGGAQYLLKTRKAPLRDENGRVVGLVGIATDVTLARRAELAAKAAEEQFEVALQGADLGAWRWNPLTDDAWYSARWAAIFGLPPDGAPMRGDTCFSRIHPDDVHLVREAYIAHERGETRMMDVEVRMRHEDGRWLNVLNRGRIFTRDAAGRPTLVAGTVLDTTERSEAARRQALLMREVDHRAKNVLAVVQALVRLTHADDVATFKQALAARIGSLGRTHTLLARQAWAGADLRALLADELAAYDTPSESAISLEGPPVLLAASAAQPLGMVIHELASNAAKHGALHDPGGTVSIRWEKKSEGALRIVWREAARHPVAPPTRRGFGSVLIEGSVRAQLGGTVRFGWTQAGLVVEIDLPADATRSQAPAAVAASAARSPVEGSSDCRVLIVEDDVVIATDLAQMTERLGYGVCGPAPDVRSALHLVGQAPAMALLDVNLGGASITPVVEALEEAKIPYAFCTGYERIELLRNDDAPRLRKPVLEADLAAVLAELRVAGAPSRRNALTGA
jgi:PAS domain S-box-containing protein